MVDFSLTDGDIRLMDLTQRDYEITRRYAREVDRTTENETNLRSGDHPDLANTPSPPRDTFTNEIGDQWQFNRMPDGDCRRVGPVQPWHVQCHGHLDGSQIRNG